MINDWATLRFPGPFILRGVCVLCVCVRACVRRDVCLGDYDHSFDEQYM